jgi:hypothetical protein
MYLFYKLIVIIITIMMLKCYSHIKKNSIIHMSSKSISSKSNRIEYELLNPKPPIHVDYPNFSFTLHKTGI